MYNHWIRVNPVSRLIRDLQKHHLQFLKGNCVPQNSIPDVDEYEAHAPKPESLGG